MTDERLCAYGDWAGHPDRDAQAARIVRELVREVRRLRAEAVPVTEFPEATPEVLARARELLSQQNARRVVVMPQPAPVPPFRGILDGITAADVYGVHV